jgi:hypothetical protein
VLDDLSEGEEIVEVLHFGAQVFSFRNDTFSISCLAMTLFPSQDHSAEKKDAVEARKQQRPLRQADERSASLEQ